MIRYVVAYFDKRMLPVAEAWFDLLNKSKYGTYQEVNIDLLTYSGEIEFTFKGKHLSYLYTPSHLFEEESQIPQINSNQYDAKIILRTKNSNAFYCAFAALGQLMQMCDGRVFNPATDVYFTGKAAIEWTKIQVFGP